MVSLAGGRDSAGLAEQPLGGVQRAAVFLLAGPAFWRAVLHRFVPRG
jgi:hypothetical protein